MPLLSFDIGGILNAAPVGSAQAAEPARTQYFRSWASYRIPYQPTDPVAYADAEEAVALYAGAYDELGRLTRFTKYLRSAVPLAGVATLDAPAVGTRAYNRAERRPDGTLMAGEAISYRETESLRSFVRRSLRQGETAPTVELVTVTVAFEDVYEYWPNGRLKVRRSRTADGRERVVTYDPSGRELAR